ncbi:MAG: YcgL domain-containing protein [Candidatus Contendobacter sp.]|nr:YcgL domain-containing protein [Candidatus Contendobacter sp.]MDG4557407.1 YcgL domain-containing protein [Candidatus Contendobacter sp.]
MQVRIYSSDKAHGLFVVLPAATDPASLPAAVKRLLSENSWVKEFELSADKPTIGLDVHKTLGDIAAQGYHVTKPQFLEE